MQQHILAGFSSDLLGRKSQVSVAPLDSPASMDTFLFFLKMRTSDSQQLEKIAKITTFGELKSFPGEIHQFWY